MKVGIYIPQVGGAAAPEHIVRIARAAEAAGFDSLWTFDHVVLRPDQGSDYPYTEDGRFLIPAETAFLEPLTLMTYVAAVTERVELGTAVLVLPMRAPVLHAKLIATLDHLAGGTRDSRRRGRLVEGGVRGALDAVRPSRRADG